MEGREWKITFEACCQELLILPLSSPEQDLNFGVAEGKKGKEGKEGTWKSTDYDRGRAGRVIKFMVSL